MSQPSLPPSLLALLGLLKDGQYHSGAVIGEKIGVSRTAVWKHLKRLSDLGLPVVSIKGKGYCLEGGIELLSSSDIGAQLNDDVKKAVTDIDVFMQVGSTNDIAMARAFEGSGYLCLAEHQKSGRGRRGREWVSPFGHNIYMSLIWEFDGGVSCLEGLSLAVGVCVVDALQDIGLKELSLKWPNDILLDGKKLGGVLLEISGDPMGTCQVVVGIGLNVRMDDKHSIGKISQPWSSISQQLGHVSRNTLVARFTNRLIPMLSNFHINGFSEYKDRWNAFDAYKNMRVQVLSGDNLIDGEDLGVDDSGALLLLQEGGVKRIYGGEVSLRVSHAS